MRLPSAYRLLHFGIGQGLKAAGFKFELRESGHACLGVWRKTLGAAQRARAHESNPVLPKPKRFVIVPGLSDTSLSWLPTTLALVPWLKKNGYTEICLIDHPGYPGHLWEKKAFHSMELLITLSNEVLTQLKPHTLLGHSLGGWLSAHYAISRQAQRTLAHLCLIAPSGNYDNEETLEHWRSYFDEVSKKGFSLVRQALVKKNSPKGKLWDVTLKALAKDFEIYFSGDEFKDFLKSVKPEHFLKNRLDAIGANTILIWGEYDEMVFTRWIHAWKSELPNAKALILKNYAHSPQMQNPLVVAHAIKQGLSSKPVRQKILERSFEWL